MTDEKSIHATINAQYDQILAFDVETTGLEKYKDNVIELAFVEMLINKVSISVGKTEDYYISLPDVVLPEFIVKLTGITDSFLRANGVSRHVVAKTATERFDSRKTLLIAHNANFDLNFLLSMLEKEGDHPDLSNIDVIDTLTVFKDRHIYPHKLEDAINVYGLRQYAKNSHRAIDDAMATVLVFEALCNERDDVLRYKNLIGINPKYGLDARDKIPSLRYCNQPYNNRLPLYEVIGV